MSVFSLFEQNNAWTDEQTVLNVMQIQYTSGDFDSQFFLFDLISIISELT